MNSFFIRIKYHIQLECWVCHLVYFDRTIYCFHIKSLLWWINANQSNLHNWCQIRTLMYKLTNHFFFPMLWGKCLFKLNIFVYNKYFILIDEFNIQRLLIILFHMNSQIHQKTIFTKKKKYFFIWPNHFI